MTMPMTDYMANNVLNWYKGIPMPTPPESCFYGLINVDTEVTEQAHAAGRIPIVWGNLSNRRILNSALMNFGAAEHAVRITALGIFDAQAGGHMVNVIVLATPIDVPAGSSISSAIGTVGVSIP